MQSKEIADTALAALREGELGWSFTDDGLRELESKLNASLSAGTFANCAFEMAALTGFLAERGDADPAVRQLTAMGEQFEPHLQDIANERQAKRQAKHARGSKFLGADAPVMAPADGKPKDGVALLDLAPHELLRDPRTFAPKRPKKR